MILNIMERLARWMAIAGGVVLVLLVLLTCVSVAGRGLNTFGHSDLLEAISLSFGQWIISTGVGPVNGDFELVEAGVAFSIFAFLPLCQLYSAHATVDVFTLAMPKPVIRFLIAFWEILLTVMIVLIMLRLFAGMQDKLRYGETTFLLQFPIWWAYALSFSAALVAAIVSIYCAGARVAELVTGRSYMPYSGGAAH